MARIRTIKPEFFKDEELADLSLAHRLLFIGLWTQADKAGRLEDRPRRLKAELFPYDDLDMDGLLDDLATPQGINGKVFIIRYTVAGRHLIQICTFTKHQRPHHTELDSTLPSYNGDITVSYPVSNSETPDGREGKGRERRREGKGEGKGDAAAAAVVQSYQRNIGVLTPHIGDQLRDLMNGQHAPPEWIVEAIEIAAEHNARSLTYVKRIVERWLTEGKDNGRPDKNHAVGNRGGKRSTAEADRFAGMVVFNVDDPDPD